jgi:hypothetical protein
MPTRVQAQQHGAPVLLKGLLARGQVDVGGGAVSVLSSVAVRWAGAVPSRMLSGLQEQQGHAGIRSLAQHAQPLYQPEVPPVEGLRRARRHGLRSLAARLPSLPGARWATAGAGVFTGQGGQLPRIRARKRPLGNEFRAEQKSEAAQRKGLTSLPR